MCERCAEIVGVDVLVDPLQASRRNAPSRVILNGVISCRLFSGRRGRRPLQMRANIDDKISKFKTVCGGRGDPSPTSAVRYNYPLNQKRQTLLKSVCRFLLKTQGTYEQKDLALLLLPRSAYFSWSRGGLTFCVWARRCRLLRLQARSQLCGCFQILRNR